MRVTLAPFTTSLLCALTVGACAAEAPMPEDVCPFGEVVHSWRADPPRRREIVFVIDTHGGIPSRAEVASAVAMVVRVVVTGDVEGDGIPESSSLDDDLRIAVISSSLDCGERVALIRRVPALGIGGDAESFVTRVENAVMELPACGSSTPLAATARFLAGQELDDVGPVVIDVVIVTDEDEPRADPATVIELRLPDPYWLDSFTVVSPTPMGLDPINPDWNALLASPVCADGLEGSRALLSAARALDDAGAANVAIGSLCGEISSAPLDAIRIHFGRYARWCIEPGALPPEGAPLECEVIEQLDPVGLHARCADLPGRDPIPIAIDDEGFETCRIVQRRADDTAPGWRFERAHDFRCTERDIEVELVGIEAEPAAFIELRCGSIPVTEECE